MKARTLLGIGLLAIAGSVWVSATLAGGTSYTPPPSGGGVSGDGTGITDPPAFRGNLGLGTAATVNTGTSAGTIPLLTTGGALPAVSGQNLTNIPGTAVTGLGTAAFGTLGTAANNVVQLNAGGGLPAVDGSNLTGVQASWGTSSWTYEWHASAGTRLLDSGWSQGATLNATETMGTGYTTVQFPASGTTASFIEKYIPPGTGSWEMRIVLREQYSLYGPPLVGYIPSSTAGNLRAVLFMQAGNNQLQYLNGSNTFTNLTPTQTPPAGLYALEPQIPSSVNTPWIHVSVRVFVRDGVTNPGYSNVYMTYMGPEKYGTLNTTTMPLATLSNQGKFIIGRYLAASSSPLTTLEISDIYLKTDGLYPEHPSYTFRNEAY